MKNYRSILLTLRWKAGELLPGHCFRIHDLAVLKSSGKVVILTDVFREAARYGYVELDELERGEAGPDDLRPCETGEAAPRHEVLREKLIRILRYEGGDHWRKLLENFTRNGRDHEPDDLGL